jgi:hypothetical protein
MILSGAILSTGGEGSEVGVLSYKFYGNNLPIPFYLRLLTYKVKLHSSTPLHTHFL